MVEAPMCVHSTLMRQSKGGSERLIVHLYSDLNTTAFHAMPADDVPLREEVVPIHDIRVTFAPGYRLGRVHLEPEGRRPEGRAHARRAERRRPSARRPCDGRGRARAGPHEAGGAIDSRVQKMKSVLAGSPPAARTSEAI